MPIGISLEGTTADKRRAQCRTMFNRLVTAIHQDLSGYPGWKKTQIQEHLMAIVRNSIEYGYFVEYVPYDNTIVYCDKLSAADEKRIIGYFKGYGIPEVNYKPNFIVTELVIGGLTSIRYTDKTLSGSRTVFRVLNGPPSLAWPHPNALKGPIRHKAMSASGPSIKSPVVYRYKGAVLIAAWVNLKLMTEHLLGQKHSL